MGLDANFYVRKYISHHDFHIDFENNDVVRVDNPIWNPLVDLLAVKEQVTPDVSSLIIVDLPVAYFRKDYVLDEWIYQNVEHLDYITKEQLKAALAHVESLSANLIPNTNDHSKNTHCITVLKRVIALPYEHFRYTSG